MGGRRDIRPIAVYKDGNSWDWQCRVPMCCQRDWTHRQRDAYAEAERHLKTHATFGFSR